MIQVASTWFPSSKYLWGFINKLHTHSPFFLELTFSETFSQKNYYKRKASGFQAFFDVICHVEGRQTPGYFL